MRRRAVTATVAGFLLLTGCAEKSQETESGGSGTGDITIGAVLDITGAGATLGGPEKQALELLAEQTNAAGGVNGRKIKLIIEDNQSTEDGAAKAMTKLVSQDKADIIIGASRSGPSLAMGAIAESSKIPMISLAANVKITEGKRWVFKTAQNDAVVLQNIIDYSAAQGWKKLGLIRDASGYGEGVGEQLNELGKPKGVSVVRTEKFAPDATDFTAQMVNIRDAKADVNLIWGIPPAAGLAQKSYRQLGIKTPVFQSHGVGNQAFLDTAGDSADGVLLPLGRLLVADQLPDGDPQKQVLTKFASDFTAKYKTPPSTFAGHAYDAFKLAIDAFQKVGTDKAKVRDHLENVKGFVGVSGVFNMSPQDHSGLGKDALAIVKVEDGKWKLVDANRG
ncbi:UNVERIFIED_ORG: amino acid/amide ABC transporter substrate-binding protein (HAAT family) [Actinomadura viridilutea]|uniref:ABC transporter substrate-binding protein n=1 Tax=Actinomadura rubrobrunea TaxID=115335 RepID=UPI000AF91DFE|nr:ABC transporter substrate-binding protein [Actinomadura rubrobrunea]